MDKKLIIGIVLAGVILFCVLFSCFGFYVASQSATDGPLLVDLPELAKECEGMGGEWLSESIQCNGVDEDDCLASGGEYTDCGSACGRDYDGACIEVCVEACYF